MLLGFLTLTRHIYSILTPPQGKFIIIALKPCVFNLSMKTIKSVTFVYGYQMYTYLPLPSSVYFPDNPCSCAISQILSAWMLDTSNIRNNLWFLRVQVCGKYVLNKNSACDDVEILK